MFDQAEKDLNRIIIELNDYYKTNQLQRNLTKIQNCVLTFGIANQNVN